jgi:gliding motility-associated-like protein
MKKCIKYLVVVIGLFYADKSFSQYYDSSQCDTNLYAPKTLCPNCDGINDVFMVLFADAKPVIFEMWIFNRWGEMIYETKDPLSGGWDGRIKNEGPNAKTGVYVWKVEYFYKIGGEKMKCLGHMSLIR